MDELGEELARCSKWLQAALDHAGGTHTLEDVEEGVRNGTLFFWPGHNSAAVTEVIEYPKRRVFHIFLAGGDLEELSIMEESATAFAKHLGCQGMSIAGRRGWVKAFKDKGYKEYLTTVIKPLEVDE